MRAPCARTSARAGNAAAILVALAALALIVFLFLRNTEEHGRKVRVDNLSRETIEKIVLDSPVFHVDVTGIPYEDFIQFLPTWPEGPPPERVELTLEWLDESRTYDLVPFLAEPDVNVRLFVEDGRILQTRDGGEVAVASKGPGYPGARVGDERHPRTDGIGDEHYDGPDRNALSD